MVALFPPYCTSLYVKFELSSIQATNILFFQTNKRAVIALVVRLLSLT